MGTSLSCLYTCLEQRPDASKILTVRRTAQEGQRKIGQRIEKQLLSPVESAKSVPLELAAFILSLLHFLLNVQANIFCSLSLSLVLPAFVTHHVLSLCLSSVCLYLVHRASWRTRGTTPYCQPSRILAAGSVSAQCLMLLRSKKNYRSVTESESLSVETSSKAPPDSDRPTRPTFHFYFLYFLFFF